MSFKEIPVKSFKGNIVSMLDDDWALLTAGRENGKYNTMTVSWGGVGVLWNKPVCFVFVRPSRYTKKFLDEEPRFTLSFPGGEQRRAMALCGKRSGRDCDKFALTGLTPLFVNGTVAVEQANTILVCKKLAVQEMNPHGFIDSGIETECYPLKDFHKVYIAEIETVLTAE